MKPLMKGVISRDQANKISPKYVEFIENPTNLNVSLNAHWILDQFYQFSVLKLGQKVLTYCHDTKQFVLAKVTEVIFMGDRGFKAVDGPTVRVGTDEYTWRVDGSSYAIPINDDHFQAGNHA